MNRPDLSNSKVLVVDIETYDPELITMGTGVYRRDGNVLGIAVNNGEFAEYYNIGHTGISPEEKSANIKYMTEVLGSKVPKLGTNLLYDLDWIENYLEIKVNGRYNDIQIAEPLLDEYRASYSLDNLAKDYLGVGKVKTVLEQKATDLNLAGDFRKHLYLFSHEEVRDYAIGDVDLPLKIFQKQFQKLKEQDLLSVYRMEMDLFPLLVQMRKTGVRVDNKKVGKGIELLCSKIKETEKELYSKYGTFNVKSSKQIAEKFTELNIPFTLNEPTTKMKAKGVAVGNPNLDKNALGLIDHDICTRILNLRGFKTLLSTFFVNSFSKNAVKGRLHCNFNPLRSDNYGTVSGRFSSSNPNLQQIPSKEDSMIGDVSAMQLCRSVFIPEEGMLWGKLDYSQIEYRVIAHFAEGPRSELIRTKYREHPETDYHKWVMDMTGLNRKVAKMLNFAMAYFMGVASCSKKFGWTEAEAEDFINLYHKEVPFIKTTRTNVVKVAKRRGFIKTVLGRRARVSAQIKERGKEHSFFNRLIQGSAADIMKKAMLDSYNAGIYNTLIPHLTVHDEIDVSIPRTKEGFEALMEQKRIMEQAVELRVPVVADLEVGMDWANVKEDWEHLK